MSVWQFAVAAQGYTKAHASDDTPAPLTVEEYEADIEAAAHKAARRTPWRMH